MKNCGANARGNFLPCLLLCFEKDPTARAEPSLVETPRALSVGGRLSSPEDEGWEFRVGRAGLGLDSWFSRPSWGMLYPVLLPSTGEAGGPERVQPQDQAWMFVMAVAVIVLGRGLIAASCG